MMRSLTIRKAGVYLYENALRVRDAWMVGLYIVFMGFLINWHVTKGSRKSTCTKCDVRTMFVVINVRFRFCWDLPYIVHDIFSKPIASHLALAISKTVVWWSLFKRVVVKTYISRGTPSALPILYSSSASFFKKNYAPSLCFSFLSLLRLKRRGMRVFYKT